MRALHTAVARYSIILCPDYGTCCKQFEIKNKLVGNMIRYLRAHFIHSEYPCRLFHFSKLRNHSSLSLFAKRGEKKNNTSLFTENRSALCWSRGYTHRLRLLTHPQPFPPSLVYATISSTLSICHSCLSQKGFHFLLFLCSALSRPLLFMRAH